MHGEQQNKTIRHVFKTKAFLKSRRK